jgi:hypothetical protein
VRQKIDPPGCESQGADTIIDNDEPGERPDVAAIVTAGDDDDGEVLDATGLPDCGWQ